MSISVCWNACPMCSVPVTFGGGSWMQYGAPPFHDGLNAPLDSHRGYHFASMAWGSKLLASSMTSRRKGELSIIADAFGHPPARSACCERATRSVARREVADRTHPELLLDRLGDVLAHQCAEARVQRREQLLCRFLDDRSQMR